MKCRYAYMNSISIKEKRALESLRMLTKKSSRFCVLLILMILVNKIKAGNDMDSLLKSLLFEGANENINKNILNKTISRPESLTNLSNNNSGLSNAKNTTTAIAEESSRNLNKIINTNGKVKTSSANATLSPTPKCHSPGFLAHESDCRKYYDCSLIEGIQNGSFHLITKSCLENQAFNIELKRCSRDISSCPLDIQCLNEGTIADPNNNSSFYLCEPRLGSGFRIFHVNCGLYEIFYWRVGKCGVDLEYFPFHRSDQPKDIDIVNAELKILKKQDKFKLKGKGKLQKENYVKAVPDAKKEAANFKCVNKGYFASNIGNKFYISCEEKNDKLKAISMQCGAGGNFYPVFGACVYSISSDDSSFSEVDDEG